MKCSRCGSEVSRGSTFCNKCGYPIASHMKPSRQRQEFPKAAVRAFAIAFAIMAASAVAFLLFRNAKPATETTPTSSDQPIIAVSIPLEAPSLDDGGTRVPVSVKGSTQFGELLNNTAFLDPDGTGLNLKYGKYEISVLESPISADGTLYSIPNTVLSITLDENAIKEGRTEPVEQALVLTPIDPESVTDEQIERAKQCALGDEERAARANELSARATERRDAARQEVEDCYVIHLGHYDFSIPEAWRDRVLAVPTDGYSARDGDGDGCVVELPTGTALCYLWERAEYDAILGRGLDPLIEYATYALANGNTLHVATGMDLFFRGKIVDPEGHFCIIDVQGASSTGEEYSERYAMQHEAAGQSDSESPMDVALACLRECAECIRITGQQPESPNESRTESQSNSDVLRLSHDEYAFDLTGTSLVDGLTTAFDPEADTIRCGKTDAMLLQSDNSVRPIVHSLMRQYSDEGLFETFQPSYGGAVTIFPRDNCYHLALVQTGLTYEPITFLGAEAAESLREEGQDDSDATAWRTKMCDYCGIPESTEDFIVNSEFCRTFVERITPAA